MLHMNDCINHLQKDCLFAFPTPLYLGGGGGGREARRLKGKWIGQRG